MLKEKVCMHEYISISKAEEKFLKQKSRNQWLKPKRDHNSSFFHRIVEVMYSRNLTKQYLWKDNGDKVEDMDQTKEGWEK
jgi:hypothetical protein